MSARSQDEGALQRPRKSRSQSHVESVEGNSSIGSGDAGNAEDDDFSSSSSSWEHEDESRESNSNHTTRTHLSFVEHQSSPPTSPPRTFEARQQHAAHVHPASSTDSSNPNAVVPADQERQILLLMLLAQVCALHDPTPRTFTVHVLELFERGILDKSSINFLYDLGLVPRKQTITQPRLLDGRAQAENKNSSEVALVPANLKSGDRRLLQHQRSIEASAIRKTLAHHENQQQFLRRSGSNSERESRSTRPSSSSSSSNSPKVEHTPSWSVEEHPLSLSRYQREFDQIELLASGSFGNVFRAVSKMDGRDYAVKRVPFAAAGYSRDSVQQVVREVQCLAVCDHPHVVRYYTSWLEPSWMTGTASGRGMGSGDSVDGNESETVNSKEHLKLLTDIQHMITAGEGSDTLSDDLKAYFKDPNVGVRPHRRRSSFSDGCFDASASSWGDACRGDSCSAWTVGQSKDDMFIDGYRSHNQSRSFFEFDNEDDIFDRSTRESEARTPESPRSEEEKRPHYNYQICLYIQMQLCHPATLADWIRTRNQRMGGQSLADRLEPAAEIFSQIAEGLSHVHGKSVVHRDLKPANVFASADGLHFKIGDFGLSKLIQRAASKSADNASSPWKRRQRQLLLLEYIDEDDRRQKRVGDDSHWQDPLTAGVGTASYAAPEQVASRDYGTGVDIFSLGLILLELLCCFSTEHERLQTFHNCRHRRKLPEEFEEYPVVAHTILACTEPRAEKRPSASDLKEASSRLSSCRHAKQSEKESILSLKRQLAAKEEELAECRDKLEMKDRIIGDLRSQLAHPKNAHSEVEADDKCSASFSSSSEDGI